MMKRKVFSVLLVIFSCLTIFVACGNETNDFTLKSDTPSEYCPGTPVLNVFLQGEITGDHYLSNKFEKGYIVTDDLFIENGTLCIEPGTTVKIAKGKKIAVATREKAALIANGFAGEKSMPIVFTSAEDTPHYNDWGNIIFMQKTDTEKTVINNCIFEYGGGIPLFGKAMISLNDTHIKIKNSTFQNSNSFGIYFYTKNSYPDDFSNNTFLNVYGAFSITVENLFRISEADLNISKEASFIELRGDSIASDTVLKNYGVPYILYGSSMSLVIKNNATLTMTEGVVFKLPSGSRIITGATTMGGLKLLGTKDNPVVITSSNEEPHKGDWDKIYLSEKTADAVFENVIIEYGGAYTSQGGKGPIIIDGRVSKFKNVTIANSAGSGLIVGEHGAFSEFDEIEFKNIDQSIMSIYFNNLKLLTANLKIDFPGDSYIEIAGGTLNDEEIVLKNFEPVIVVKKDITLGSNANLTVKGGVTFAFENGVKFLMGFDGENRVFFQGLENKPIMFTSAREIPSPGDFDKIVLGPGVSNDSVFENVIVEYGGQFSSNYGRSNISIIDSSPTIKNSTIRYSKGYGIYVSKNANPVIENITYEYNEDGDLYKEQQ